MLAICTLVISADENDAARRRSLLVLIDTYACLVVYLFILYLYELCKRSLEALIVTFSPTCTLKLLGRFGWLFRFVVPL